MDKQLINDIIGWDIKNWGKSISFFENNIDFSGTKKALELGCGFYGGYSLYFSSKGIKTICSNNDGNFEHTKKIHKL